VAVDGEEVTAASDLADLLAAYEPGDTVTLQVERDGEDLADIEVELGEHPDDENAPYLGVLYRSPLLRGIWEEMPGFFGKRRDLEEFDLEAIPLDPDEELDLEEMPFPDLEDLDLDELGEEASWQGCVLRQVEEDSPASDAGLQKGDLITAVDGESLDGPQALADAIAQREPGDEITLTVYSRDADEEQDVEVTLGENPDDEEKAYLGVTVGGYFMQRFSGSRNQDRSMPFGWRFESEEDSEEPGRGSPFGFHFDLPFDLDDLPFDLDELPDLLPFGGSGDTTLGGSA
jgi:hypothetical protein